MSPAVWSAHLFCTLFMCGIIWFVQIVHYPLLHYSDGPDAQAGHRAYTRRMGRVVVPVMLAELVLQGWWLGKDQSLPAILGAGLLLAIWLSTFLLQVPCHRKLEQHADRQVQARLVKTNWIRTVAWTARSLLLLSLPVWTSR